MVNFKLGRKTKSNWNSREKLLPYSILLLNGGRCNATSHYCSSKEKSFDIRGFEPLTICLQCQYFLDELLNLWCTFYRTFKDNYKSLASFVTLTKALSIEMLIQNWISSTFIEDLLDLIDLFWIFFNHGCKTISKNLILGEFCFTVIEIM